MAQNGQSNGAATRSTPAQPASKADAATPRLNNEMEMGDLPGDKPAESDIMHMARTGDVAGMEKLLESTELDATYSDDEGITPLHVSQSLRPKVPFRPPSVPY